ncbi:MAG: DHH family phosphoesterase [Sphaerochaeta sp.]|jgi:phosphoesterase RecJ-like protein|nr:DHH family phosphoesterase [Sphaerochaeta sp.]PKL28934.1 MAG: recombinase RecJ [Spirochaetae bacterium HGW-Spirochaetae-2]
MFTYPDVSPKIIDEIRSCSVAVVVGHVGPDGDCIHSQIAMQKLLQRLGVEVHLANAGPFSRKEIKKYEPLFAPHVDKQLYDRNPLVVMVDCSTLDRIGYLGDEIKGLTLLTIDHHASGSKFGDLTYIVPKSFSTSLCVMQLYKALDVEMTYEIADHIFFGLATDTGFLKFIGPYRGETFQLMGELVELGVSPNDIYSRMEGGNTFASQRFLGRLLQRAEPLLEGRIMCVIEEPSDLEEFSSKDRPSDTLYAHLLSVDDVEAVLYFKISGEDLWEIGFRASHASSLDVGAISASLGGGGHRKAAGATVKGTLAELKSKLIEILRSLLD